MTPAAGVLAASCTVPEMLPALGDVRVIGGGGGRTGWTV